MRAHVLVPALLGLIAGGCGGGDMPLEGPVVIGEASSCPVDVVYASPIGPIKFPDNCPVWQIDGGNFETDQSVIHLSGVSFAPESNNCSNPPLTLGGPICIPIFPGNTVRWMNVSNGIEGSGTGGYGVLGTAEYLGPGWYVVPTGGEKWAGWSTQNDSYPTGIPLQIGVNSINVGVVDADHIGSSQITITRVVDTTPPTPFSLDPAPDGRYYSTVIVYFAEQLDPQRVAGSIEVFDSNGQPVAGTIVYSPLKLRLTWRPDSTPPSGVYSARLSNIADSSGNTIAAPLEWSFTKQ